MSDIVSRARAALDGVTEGPWERGDHYHVQGASHCECRPGNGRLVAEKQMDINGEMMLAHVHRSSEPWWPYGIYSPRDTGGVLVVQETHEHGMMTKADAEFIAWARTGVPELLAEVERLRAQIAADRHDREHWAYAALDAQDKALTAQINEAVEWGRDLEVENSRLRAQIAAARETHQRVRNRPHCGNWDCVCAQPEWVCTCGEWHREYESQPWPCPTIRALDGEATDA